MNKSKGVSILQDVKKMKRSIRLRQEEDPEVVNVLLDNILRDSLLARQALGQTRLGQNAVNEIRNIRNDLISGTINAGSQTKEQIAKYSAVYDEVTKIESRNDKVSSPINDIKSSVRDILPSRGMVTSALIAANPIAGYAFKIGSNLFSTSGKTDVNDSFDPEAILNPRVAETSGRPNAGDNEVIERLDKIVGYLEDIKPNVDSLDKSSSDLLRLERTSVKEQSLLARESEFESYGGSGEIDSGRSREMSDMLASSIGGIISGAQNDGEEESMTIRDVAAGSAAGTILSRMLLGGVLLGASKIVAIGAAGYFLYKYRDEILSWLREAEIPGILGVEGGTEGIRESVSSTARAIQEMDDVVNASEEMQALLNAQRSMQDNLASSEARFDELLERSNEEMLDGGITEETANEMRELNAEIEILKDNLNRLKQEIRETRIQGRRNYQSSNQNSEVIQISRGEDFNTFAELIRQAESAHGQFNPDGSTVVGPPTKYGRAVGAMQILESTAEEQANRMGIEYDRDRLFNDAEYNKMLGEGYLSFLLERYNGNPDLASFAYNAGPGAADRMRREFGTPGVDISREDFLSGIENRYPSTEFSSWASQTVPYVRKTGAMMNQTIDMESMNQSPNVSTVVSESMGRETQEPQQTSPSINVVNNSSNTTTQSPQSNNMPSADNNEPAWRRMLFGNGIFSSF